MYGHYPADVAWTIPCVKELNYNNDSGNSDGNNSNNYQKKKK